jgi:hypothetical protein
VPDLVVAEAGAVMLEDTPQDPYVVPTARVLLLLAAFARRRPDGVSVSELAAADFLLRHPPLLVDALARAGVPVNASLLPTGSERLISERTALRLRYGPWDERYQLVAGRLISVGLARLVPEDKRLVATPEARSVVDRLRSDGWERTWGHATAAARLMANRDVSDTLQAPWASPSARRR